MPAQVLALVLEAVNQTKGELSRAANEIENVSKYAEKSHGPLSGLGKSLGNVASIAGGFVVAQGLLQLPGLMGGMIGSASDLNETLSKSNTIFKDQADEIEAWASKASRSFGMTKTQALDSASGLGNMFTQLGIGSEKAATMSTSMTELAADFASFHNADITEVLSAQSAAFRGEYDAVQRFVPTINAAAVEQKALAMGLAKTTKELDAQDKALATQALLLEGAGEAMGDFDRTSSGMANTQRTLDARMSELGTTIGEKLLPVKLAFANLILDKVLPAMEAIGPVIGKVITFITDLGQYFRFTAEDGDYFNDFLSHIPEPIRGIVQAIGELVVWVQTRLIPAFQELVAQVRPKIEEFAETVRTAFAKFPAYYEENIKPAFENIKRAIGAVVDFVAAHWPQILEFIRPVIEQVQLVIETAFGIVRNLIEIIVDLLGGDFSGAWNNLKDLVGVVWDGIVGTVENAIGLIANLGRLMWDAGKKLGGMLFDGIKAAVSAVGGLASDIGEAIMNAIKRFVNTQVIDRVNRALEFNFGVDVMGQFVGVHVNPPDIPHLAAGGIVTRPTLALIGEAGPEAVVPLSRGGGMGHTFNINVTAGVGSDPVVIANTIVGIINQSVRNGGAQLDSSAVAA